MSIKDKIIERIKQSAAPLILAGMLLTSGCSSNSTENQHDAISNYPTRPAVEYNIDQESQTSSGQQQQEHNRIDAQVLNQLPRPFTSLDGVIIEGSLEGVKVSGVDFTGALGPDGGPLRINVQEVLFRSIALSTFNGVILEGSFDGVEITGANFQGAVGADGEPLRMDLDKLHGSICNVDFTGILNLDGTPIVTNDLMVLNESPWHSLNRSEGNIIPEGLDPITVAIIDTFNDSPVSHGAIVRLGFNQVVQNDPVNVIEINSEAGSGTSWADGIRQSIDQGARIINLSQGNLSGDALEELFEVVNYAQERGAIIVWASGNQQREISGENARWGEFQALPNVVTAGSVSYDENGNLIPSRYSNFGSELNVVAKAQTRVIVDGIGHSSGGTSYAAPRITGALALIWGSNPDMSWQEVIEKLHDISNYLSSGQSRDNMTGHGIPELSRLER